MSILAGAGLSILAGVMQGAFPLPMKYAAKWKWENTWSVFTFWGFVVLPWLLAFLTVPDLIGVYASASGGAIAAVTLLGAGWGIGTVCFGIGVSMVGLALASALVVGMAGALGTLVPMAVLRPEAFGTPAGMAISAGVVLMLIGVAVCAAAGSRKEKALSTASKQAGAAAGARSFGKGLIVCMISGIASPMLNFAFAFGGEVVANAKAAGASPACASNAVWCWTMTSAFVTTLVYSAYLMSRDRGWRRYVLPGTGLYWGLTLLMGLLWSGSIAVYGIALSKLGELGPSIGWSILMSTVIITGGVLGIATGEWKGAGRRPLVTLIAGLAVLMAAICVIGAGNK